MPLSKRAAAEFFGTFWLVFGGCGSAVIAAAFPAVWHRASRGSAGLRADEYSRWLTPSGTSRVATSIPPLAWASWWPNDSTLKDPTGLCILAQVLGAIAGAGILYVIASGKAGYDVAAGFDSNVYAEHSPGQYSMTACLVAEVVLTFFFLMIILGSTDRRAPAGFAPIAIGLGLTLIHLIGIPVTNLSVNPARSTGPALFVGGWALGQLWLFWCAPIVGAAAAGIVYPMFAGEPATAKEPSPATVPAE